MEEAVLAFVEHKYAQGKGIFRDDGVATSWRNSAAVLADIPRYSDRTVAAAVWFPIAAMLTPANLTVSRSAPVLLREVPAEVPFVLGDRHYNTPDLHKHCEQADRLLVTTRHL